MDHEIVAAALALLGSVIGTFSGILVNAKLTNYRLSQLENKVDKHNQVVERVYGLEKQSAVICEEIKVANHRISDLEDYHK